LPGEGSSNCPSLGEETEALLGSLLVKKAKEGFFMPRSIPNGNASGTSGFQQVVQAFLSGAGLPFAGVPSAERIERVFQKHRCDFGHRRLASEIPEGISPAVAVEPIIQLGECLERLSLWEESLENYQKAEAAYLKILGPKHPATREVSESRERVQAELERTSD
jgi:hypothetical protein